jgi:hypothetical protein
MSSKKLTDLLLGRSTGPQPERHLRNFSYASTEEQAAQGEHFRLSGSKPQAIDCALMVGETDAENARRAPEFYVTYQETIERAGVQRNIPREAVFEIYQEQIDPPVVDLFEGPTWTR